MNIQEAIEKAAKLLRMAKSDNVNEAAIAAAKAQELMERYKLTGQAVEMAEAQKVESVAFPDEPIQDFKDSPLTPAGRLEVWLGTLAVRIGKLNQCHCYRSRNGLSFIGRASDVSVARYFFNFIRAEIERLANRYCAGHGMTYFNNFRHGAVDGVCGKMEEAKAATLQQVKNEAHTLCLSDSKQGGMALAVIIGNAMALQKRHDEAVTWGKVNLKLRAGSRSRTRYDSGAREAGRAAGRSINTGGGRGIGNGGFHLG